MKNGTLENWRISLEIEDRNGELLSILNKYAGIVETKIEINVRKVRRRVK